MSVNAHVIDDKELKFKCPKCGSDFLEVVERKIVVTEIWGMNLEADGDLDISYGDETCDNNNELHFQCHSCSEMFAKTRKSAIRKMLKLDINRHLRGIKKGRV